MSYRSSTPSPIFIVGPPRSGTHLVRFCLAQHSNLFIAPETAYFIRCYGNRKLARKPFTDGNSAKLVDELIDCSGDPTMKEWHGERQNLKACVAGATTYGEFADRFFGYMAQHHGRPRWGEKTPLHALYIGQILNVYPEAKIIFVTRDAKNTIASTLKSSHVHWGLGTALANYLACSKALSRHQHDRRVHSVQYEQFVSAPEQEIRTLCAFLEEPFQETMLTPGMLDSSYADSVMSINKTIGIVPDQADKWRQQLTLEQADFIDAMVEGRVPRATSAYVKQLRSNFLLYLRLAKNRAGYFHLKSHLGGQTE